MTWMPFTVTVRGVMSRPVTFSACTATAARSAKGTLTKRIRGTSSAPPATVMPRYRVSPSKRAAGNAVTEPSTAL